MSMSRYTSLMATFRDDWSLQFPLIYLAADDRSIATLECSLNRASDPSSFALQMALSLLTADYSEEEYQTVWPLVGLCLRVLQKEGFDAAQNDRMLDCFALRDLNGPCNSIAPLVLLLLEVQESEDSKVFWPWFWPTVFLSSVCVGLYSYADSVDILSIIMQKGGNFNATNQMDLTASTYARYHNRWELWCEALERDDKKIEDVVRAEGNQWLLNDDWREVWIDRRYTGWESLLPHESDEQVSKQSSDGSEYDSELESDAIVPERDEPSEEDTDEERLYQSSEGSDSNS
jgi:hypothetical protein